LLKPNKAESEANVGLVKGNITITDAGNEDCSTQKKTPLIPSLKTKIQQVTVGGTGLGLVS